MINKAAGILKNNLKNIFMMLLMMGLLALLMVVAFASETSVVYERAHINPYDMASIKRGAKIFSAVCITCHTMKYMKYNKVAQEAGITPDRMQLNKKNWYFGITPPDLTLVTKVRSPDWVNTYLHSFYVDPSRPSGVNNLLVHNTIMPDMLRAFQGDKVRIQKPVQNIYLPQKHTYDELQLIKQGSLPPEQFDAMVNDIVNFLNYAAEPYRVQQMQIGYWVITYLVILFILMLFLKRTYWKAIKRDALNSGIVKSSKIKEE